MNQTSSELIESQNPTQDNHDEWKPISNIYDILEKQEGSKKSTLTVRFIDRRNNPQNGLQEIVRKNVKGLWEYDSSKENELLEKLSIKSKKEKTVTKQKPIGWEIFKPYFDELVETENVTANAVYGRISTRIKNPRYGLSEDLFKKVGRNLWINSDKKDEVLEKLSGSYKIKRKKQKPRSRNKGETLSVEKVAKIISERRGATSNSTSLRFYRELKTNPELESLAPKIGNRRNVKRRDLERIEEILYSTEKTSKITPSKNSPNETPKNPSQTIPLTKAYEIIAKKRERIRPKSVANIFQKKKNTEPKLSEITTPKNSNAKKVRREIKYEDIPELEQLLYGSNRQTQTKEDPQTREEPNLTFDYVNEFSSVERNPNHAMISAYLGRKKEESTFKEYSESLSMLHYILNTFYDPNASEEFAEELKGDWEKQKLGVKKTLDDMLFIIQEYKEMIEKGDRILRGVTTKEKPIKKGEDLTYP